MKRFLEWCALGLAAALLLSPPARADLSFGYEARYVGLGGAGLAIIDNPTQAALVNPAALSLRPLGFGIQWPNFGFRWRGGGFGDALSHLASGSISTDEANDLARDLGSEPTRIEASLGFGLAASVADLRFRSLASVLVRPRAEFARWATSGADISNFLANNYANQFAGLTTAAEVQNAVNQISQQLGADVIGAAAISPSFGVGVRVPDHLLGNGTLGDVRVGVRLKPTRIYYSHYVVRPTVDVNAITSSDFNANGFTAYNKIQVRADAAPELGSDTSLSETSWGVDFGLLWQPALIPYTTFALTVDNLIEPSFTFPAGADPRVVPVGEKLLPRTVNLGAAISVPGGLLLAADLLDVTGANKANPNGEAQFRVGAEFRPNLPGLRLLAVRAGYNSATGMAAGFSIGGFGIAYASRSPLVASQTFNF